MKRYGKFFRSLYPNATGSAAAPAAAPTPHVAVSAPAQSVLGGVMTVPSIEEVKAAQLIISAYVQHHG
jgi:hypothetical protein